MRQWAGPGLSLAAAAAALLTAGGIALTLEARQSPPKQAALPASHFSVIDEYCVSCHDEDKKKGELALDTVAGEALTKHPDVWEKVIRKLRARQMPPVGKPRPDDRTYDAMVAYLETSLDRLAAAKPNPGRTATIRRLTRTEYQNAVRDLLALNVDVSSLLPADEASYGFDNVTVGDLSPTLLDRYVAAAEKISRLALGFPPTSLRKATSPACRSARAAVPCWTTHFRVTASTSFRSASLAIATNTSRG
jgi:mono/diheme cytochrome c family protein